MHWHWSAVVRVLGVLLAGLLAGSAKAQPLPAQPFNHVVDLANVIRDDVERELIGYLLELEQKTGAQMIVLTVNSTDGVPIEEFGHQTAERWRLGQRDRHNGLLLVVAVQDRKYRIEVGYGLEDVLPDGLCGRVLREVLAPHLRRGEYSEGIREATLVLANRVANAAGVQITGLPRRMLPIADSGPPIGLDSCLPCCAVVLFLFIFFGARGYQTYRYRHYMGDVAWWLLLTGLSSGRRTWGHDRHGGSWGGFGGFGGGGFGGGFGGGGFGGGSFGGGGGGSFGGGGASGGW